LLLFSSIGVSQNAELILGFDKIRIGEQIPMTIKIEYADPKDNVLIGWPQFDDEFTKQIEITDRTVDFVEVIDSLTKTYSRRQDFQITSFEPGLHLIPPIGIELNDSVYYTYPTNLLVETIEVDTSKGITDIKENYAVDYTFSEKLEDWFAYYWPWLAGAGVLVALFFIFRLVKNRKKEEVAPYIPPIPAHITALKSLKKLEAEKAWTSIKQKEYYSDLTYTVRLYLEERFGINAVEQTTREIIAELKYADISEEDKLHLRKMLSQADMIKFAKMTANEEQGKDSLYKSIDFVEKTKKISNESDELAE
jgi:hypothetical protein